MTGFAHRIALALVVLGAACAHSRSEANATNTSRGALLRFKPKVGGRLFAKVRINVEADSAAEHAAFGFSFSAEETIDKVAEDGTASVSARLLDATGEAGASTDQKTMDALALAFDELKIRFKRSLRGEVTELAITDIRAPLDDKMARTVVSSVYGAAHGPILPEEPVDVGSTWKVETDIGTAVGVVGKATHSYVFVRKSGNLSVLSCESTMDAKGPGGARKHMSSKQTSEYGFDGDSGRLQSILADSSLKAEEGTPASVRQRVTFKWTAE